MAEGQHCIHCWWQETDHSLAAEFEADADPEVAVSGYKYSARKCPGFEPEDPESEFLSLKSKLEYLQCETPEEFADAAQEFYRESEYSFDVANRMRIQFQVWQEKERSKK